MHCVMYVTCEPSIMCAAALLASVKICQVFFGYQNDWVGLCGLLLSLHQADILPSMNHKGFPIHGCIMKQETITVLLSFYD